MGTLKWLLVLWSAFHACCCFRQSCLNAPSFADDELSVVTCNSTNALLSWNVGLHMQDFSSLAFEYSCLKISDSGLLIPIVGQVNRSLPWHTDGTSGFTDIPLIPEATCMFSACYSAQNDGTVFVSPTGCLAASAATSAQSEVVPLEQLSASTALVFTDGFIGTSALPLTSTTPAPGVASPNVVNRITFGVVVAIAVVVFIVIAALGLTIGLCAIRALERNAIKKELRIIGAGLAEKVDISYAPVTVALCKVHNRGIYFTSQTSILDNLEKPQPATSTELNSTLNVNSVSIQGTHQSLCNEVQVEQRCFPSYERSSASRKLSFDLSESSDSSITEYTAEECISAL